MLISASSSASLVGEGRSLWSRMSFCLFGLPALFPTFLPCSYPSLLFPLDSSLQPPLLPFSFLPPPPHHPFFPPTHLPALRPPLQHPHPCQSWPAQHREAAELGSEALGEQAWSALTSVALRSVGDWEDNNQQQPTSTCASRSRRGRGPIWMGGPEEQRGGILAGRVEVG